MLHATLILASVVAFALTWASNLKGLDENNKTYPKFYFSTTLTRKCRPSVNEGKLSLPQKEELRVGWIGRVLNFDDPFPYHGTIRLQLDVSLSSLLAFTFYSPPKDKNRGEVEVTTIEHELELKDFRRKLIDGRIKAFIEEKEDYAGVILDPDAIEAPKDVELVELSVDGLRERAQFLESWKEKLELRQRGNFIIRLLDNKSQVDRARGDLLIKQEKTTNAIFQVVGCPKFSPQEFEEIRLYHPSMGAMIPSAGFVVQIEDIMEKVLKEETKNVEGAGDWTTSLVSDYYYKQMVIGKQDVEDGLLEEILKVLQKTKMIITWTNLKNQYEIDDKTSCTLKKVELKEQREKTFDLMFTFYLQFDDTLTKELLMEKEKVIEEIIYLQYEAIILRTLTKVPTVSSLHIYPLVEMTEILEKINMTALSRVLEKWASFGPKLDINFYYLRPTGYMPDDESWMQFCNVVDTYFALHIKTNNGDKESSSSNSSSDDSSSSE